MKAYIKYVTAMLIFGSVGIFVKNISLSSVDTVVCRTIIATLYLLFVMVLYRKNFDFGKIKQNSIPLLLSGGALGFNWLFLFIAYKNTSVSMATILYYLAPVMVMMFSPIVLKEKLSLYKLFGIALSLLGIILVNSSGNAEQGGIFGMVAGLTAAFFYALLILFNKFIKDMSSLETTVIQLIIATIILLPYAIYSHSGPFTIAKGDILPVIILGVVHTGTACLLYFSAMKDISGQSIALVSYIDPLSALCFSMIFLQEKLTMLQFAGAGLILFGALAGEGLLALRAKRISRST